MMEDNIKANGIKIKCMVMVCLLGRMEELMMESIIWIKKKVLEFFIGQMEENIEEIGRMGNKMEKELI